MTEKPILEMTTAEVKAQFQAKEEAQPMARVAAAGFGSSSQERRVRDLAAFERQWGPPFVVFD
jgi:hypothetical protein